MTQKEHFEKIRRNFAGILPECFHFPFSYHSFQTDPRAGFSQLGSGEMYADPGGSRQGPDRLPAVCIFAEGVLYRASQS